ncbi:tetratricopeptide repeat protein [bacterium]|nr:tetratricopeptide repeat protein [bacterium]
MKNLFALLIIFFTSLPAFCAGGTSVTYVIDPEKNAFEHNNLGIMYVEEKCYYAAIQEFKMAISLNPRTQATAVYFNNLGKVYMTIGYPNLALDCFKNAIIQYNLSLEYYQNLVQCYKALGQINSQLANYKKQNKTPLDKIMLGLLYEQTGDIKKAIITLDEFINSEPDLLITPSVKIYIQNLVNQII